MPARSSSVGLGVALVAGAAFGSAGAFGTALVDAGWSAGAVVLARIGVAAVALSVPAGMQLRRAWPALAAAGPAAHRRMARLLLAYGLVAVAGCQFVYLRALATLSVGVAMLLEYLGIVLVVGWLWLRHGKRPRRLTAWGSVLALVGLLVIVGATGTQRVDLAGVAWGLAAAVGLAVYYVLGARDEDALPPLVVAWAALTLGAVGIAVVGVCGVLPLHATFGDVRLAGHSVSWLVPVLGTSLVAAAIAYVAGITAARLLGATVASFVGLSEVLFAVLAAWLLISQVPSARDVVGGICIVGGVALVRAEDLRRRRVAGTVAEDVPVPVRA